MEGTRLYKRACGDKKRKLKLFFRQQRKKLDREDDRVERVVKAKGENALEGEGKGLQELKLKKK